MRQISKSIACIILAFVSLFLLSAVNKSNLKNGGIPVYRSNFDNPKKIAITFDDGPHPLKTEKILEILDEEKVKATFFVVGKNVNNYPEAMKKIIESGHEIGNHTYNHIRLESRSEAKIIKELKQTEKIVNSCGGEMMEIIRPPEGIFDDKLISIANKNNYKIILWNIDTKDWSHASCERIVENVIKNVKGGDIILFHDYTSGENHTIDALKIVIDVLKKKGYEFATVSELLENK